MWKNTLFLFIAVYAAAIACGPSSSDAPSQADEPQFEEGVALDLVKKALRRVSARQEGCGLILRIGDWSEEYQGRGLWLVQARRGKPFRIDEATQTVTEFSTAADHTHDAYVCHPSRG